MGRIPTIYYCSYENCSASYNRLHRYETHLRSHTGVRPFICSEENCGKSYASVSHLKRHEESHGSPLKCTVNGCTEMLKTKATLKKHIKTVHLKAKKKLYACLKCNREFNKHCILQRHINKHTGVLPYKCSIEKCGKQFLTPSRLKRHMKIHEGYSCQKPNCDKVFEKWSLYVKHTKDAHPIEHKCDACSKVFTSSYALKLHTPIHDESRPVFPCEFPNCSRFYYAKKNLNWHVKKYHAKRPFSCDKENCFKAFKTEAELADHILHHGEKRKPRRKKIKPKKSKPSFAAILAGCVEPKGKSFDPITSELQKESNAPAYYRQSNRNILETETTQMLADQQASIIPACSNEKVSGIEKLLTNLRSEAEIFTCTDIEVISNGHSQTSHVISVPVIKTVDDKSWIESGAILVQEVS